MSNHLDVLIVGAGLSGIGAAHRLQTHCPDRSYAILEARDASGGTWDFFRYPGLRSDSDMFTLGYPLRPWLQPNAIADGASILAYIRETATENGIDKKIHYGRRVVSAAWSSEQARWTLTTAEGTEWTCNFLYLCTGYYRYSSGHEVAFPGMGDYAGHLVHPQNWPAELDYEGKRVVVIGSGATAVTLVPALAQQAAHVTMVQRSPTYMIPLASKEPLTAKLGKRMSPERASRLIRKRNVAMNFLTFQASRRWPEKVGQMLRDRVAGELPEHVKVDPHFTPRYKPGDQRVCGVADGDLFAALREGRTSIVTGEVETFTEKGLRLTDGQELEADVVVTATGLVMVTFGEVALSVDGKAVNSRHLQVYKHLMFSGLPNLAWCVGYTNASWTMRADLSHQYVCRLLNHMARRRYDVATPVPKDAAGSDEPLLNLSSGYVLRASDILPRQGTEGRWKVRNNYLRDWPRMKLTRINDGALVFKRRVKA